jgi:outer membrane protein OmpA-like peptidoglycan-associated protein
MKVVSILLAGVLGSIFVGASAAPKVTQTTISDDRFFCLQKQSAVAREQRFECFNKTKPIFLQQLTIEQSYLKDSLNRVGVQIIQQGLRLQIRLPVDKFFALDTRQVIAERQQNLSEVAKYLKNYGQLHRIHYPVKVTGYSDKVGTLHWQHQISYEYAQAIAASLWNRGFSVAQLQVAGYGAEAPIAKQHTADGRSWNRRVMIQVN